MGEVYRATDTRLGREVALKVLLPAFSTHPDRLARFDREAKLLATLNHPNIGSLYGVEEANGVRALVMELVEGPTLADRLKTGPVPLEEALGIAKQIVEALEAAHERGIIHRDLKPANIKLTADERVKVLDFGLARALEDEPVAGLDRSPTLSAIATKAGIILGTAAYMSPEQAKGKPADRRADVWSFGVVLYEMLAGKPLFAGETPSEILAAVIKEEPDWSALPTNTPAALRKLLRRCLTKDPKRRLQAIGEARIAIEEYAADPNADSVVMSAITARPAAWQRILPWALAGLFFLATALALWSPWRTEKIEQPIRLTVELGADASVATAFGAAAILSPDGTRLAFVALGADGKQRIYLRPLDQLEATPLSGTEGAIAPFFSPDGEWIGFFADGKLKKVAVQGGAPVALCNAPGPRGGSWSEDGTIVFAPNVVGGLFRVSSAGGTPQSLTTLGKGEGGHRWPQVLPGGEAVVFMAGVGRGSGESKIMAYSLRSGTHEEIHGAGVMYARYLPAAAGLPSGHLVYLHEGTLFAAPFDLDRLEMTGQPAPVLDGVFSNVGTGATQFAFSGTGALVYLSGKGAAGAPLQWLNARGKLQPLRDVPASYGYPRFSPDGKRLAVTVFDSANVDVWVYDWARDNFSRFTYEPGMDLAAVWTPDGQRLTFASASGGGSTNIYWQRADGTGAIERLTDSENPRQPWSWTPDGKALAFTEVGPETSTDILVLPMEGDERTGWKPGKPQVFLNSPFIEYAPAFSPDGRWMAYQANDTGTFEVYVRPFPSSAGKWQISSGGGHFPKWSPNGRQLFYRSADNRIMVATYRVVGNSFLADKPRVWSETQVEHRGPSPTFDLHPDGKRFVVLKAAEGEKEPGIQKAILVLNFSEELRRRVPTNNK